MSASLLAGFLLGTLEALWEILFPDLASGRLFGPWQTSVLILREYGVPLLVLNGSLGGAVGGALFLLTRNERLVWRILWIGAGGMAGSVLSGTALYFRVAAGTAAGWHLGKRLRMTGYGRRFAAAGLFLLAAGWVGTVIQRTGWTPDGFAQAAPSEAPHVLILTIDSLRADHLSLYGYPKKTTPFIDAFARKGAFIFRDCQAHATWTKPSVAAMITGRPQPLPSSKVRLDEMGALSAGEETLTERFHRFGYKTGWFAANPNLTPEFGMPQQADGLLVPRLPGFITRRLSWGRTTQRILLPRWPSLEPFVKGIYHLADVANGNWRRPWWIGDEELRDAFLKWLPRKPGEKPWMAYIHFMGVHAPYGDTQGKKLYPPRNKSRPENQSIALPSLASDLTAPYLDAYDADIPYTDACIGQILQVLEERGELEKTIVVITADHGEEFGEHGAMGHGFPTLHRGVTHVPLILRTPGMRTATWVDGPVQHIDVVPTLLSLAKLPPDPALPGTDLAALGRQIVLTSTRPALYQVYYHFPSRWYVASLRSGNRLLYAGKTDRGIETALYNLEQDPQEKEDLGLQHPELVREIMTQAAQIDPAWKNKRSPV